jgi:hypothetical protein
MIAVNRAGEEVIDVSQQAGADPREEGRQALRPPIACEEVIS